MFLLESIIKSVSKMNRLFSEVIDTEQLKRIESVHRGFLYQHLYAVACILNLGMREKGEVRVERDEDVEYITDEDNVFIQVKTRSCPLMNSDINGALVRFVDLRKHFASVSPGKSFRFLIVSNQVPGPKLAKFYVSKDWPKDVSIVFPGEVTLENESLPPAWENLEQAVRWCIEAADNIPFTTLLPETLVWKLAARVQFATTGQDFDRADHVFDRSELPLLFEQLVVQLQQFPAIPDDFKPQENEPVLISDEPARLIVGFSGSGKTVWASWQAQHCSAPAVYFDVGDLPDNALAGSLARELAARFIGTGNKGAAQLPATSGLELLRALNNLIEQPEPPLVVLDNIHRIDADNMRNIIEACTNVRFILLAQPWPKKQQLEAYLNIQSEQLCGWNVDTIASVFANVGATISPQTATQWRSITAGMPLFVKNAAMLTVNLADGDAAVFAEQVERGDHPEELAQEALLRMTIETLSDDETAITVAFSLSTVPLSTEEVGKYLEALPTLVKRQPVVMRSLQRKGIIQVFANGVRKIHDAMRVPIENIILFSTDETLALQVKLRDVLLESLLKDKDLSRFGAWMRLLAPTGQVETLVDIATTEYFHEYGEPQDLKEILVSIAEAEDTDLSLRFWTLDALAFWEYQELEPKRLPDNYLKRMEELIVTGDLGSREHAGLVMKQMLNAGIKGDKRSVDDAFSSARELCGSDPELSRIVRYNYATALYQCSARQDALVLAEALYAEYYDVLKLHPIDVIGANNQRLIDLLPRDLAECQDDLKHLADCLNLAAMCHRENGDHPRFAAIHAAKFYNVSGSYRSTMKTAQDITDDFIGIGDVEGARETMEEHAIPLLKFMGFNSNALDVRAQYAVVLAYCGEFNLAHKEMSAIEPYVAEASHTHQLTIANQRHLIEQIAAGNVTLPKYCVTQTPKRSKKIGRNDLCPCESGKKYKKCCLKGNLSP